MSRFFRTITAVVEVDDTSDLRYVGYATEVACKSLESAGFLNVRVRNTPNDTGDMPPSGEEVAW